MTSMDFFRALIFLGLSVVTFAAQARIYSSDEISHLYRNQSALNEQQITTQQKSYFEGYMETEGNAYVRLNSYLRSDRTPAKPALDKIANSMLKAFDEVGGKLPLDLNLFRGSAFGYLGRYPNLGEVISDKAFISTSISADTASGFGFANYPLSQVEEFSAIMMIYAETELIRGLYIRHSDDSDESSEGEVLLKPKSKFVVMDAFDIQRPDPFDEGAIVNRRLLLVKSCSSQSTCENIQPRVPDSQIKNWNEFKSCMHEKRECRFNQ